MNHETDGRNRAETVRLYPGIHISFYSLTAETESFPIDDGFRKSSGRTSTRPPGRGTGRCHGCVTISLSVYHFIGKVEQKNSIFSILVNRYPNSG